MQTFATIVGAVLLTLSLVATSDARPHDNRLGPTQSESPYYDADYSQRNTRN